MNSQVLQTAWLWSQRVSVIYFAQSMLAYIGACIVAGHPVGVTRFIAFLNHCCQWAG